MERRRLFFRDMISLGIIPHTMPLYHAWKFSDHSVPDWIEAPTFARMEATVPSQKSDFTGKSHYDAILGVCVSNNPEVRECSSSHTLRRSEEEDSADESLRSPSEPTLILSLDESVQVLGDLHVASRDFTEFDISKSVPGTIESHDLKSLQGRDIGNGENWNYFDCIQDVSEEIAAEASCKLLFSLLPKSAHHPLFGPETNMICGMTTCCGMTTSDI
jgi:hypothetical protein